MSPVLPHVRDVVAGVRRDLRTRVWTATVVWLTVLVAAVLLVAWLVAGPAGWSEGTPWPFVLDLLLAVGVTALLVLLRGVSKRWLSERSVSGAIEDATGLPRGSVLGSLELGRDVPVGVSPALAVRAERRIASRLDAPARALGGRLSDATTAWARHGGVTLFVLLPLLVSAVYVSPDRAARAFAGLGSPVRHLLGPTLPPLEVEPGDVEVRRGGDVTIRVRAAFRDSVIVHWQAAGDVARSRAVEAVQDVATHVVRDVQAPVRYRVSAPDGAESANFTITPVDPLLVADVDVTLAFPAHTGRLEEEYRGDVPPLALPVGTRISIDGRANRVLRGAGLAGEDGTVVVELQVEGESFSGAWTPTSGGTFEWRFTGRDGEQAELVPLPLQITLLPDSVPRVRFTFPARDTVLPLSLRQPLSIEAGDDYGLAAFELVAYRVTSLGERREPIVQPLQVRGSRSLLARPLIDVSGWGLLPGDTVRYFARVRDNAPIGQVAQTREFVLRMPGAAELRRAVEEGLDDAAERMEEIADRAAEAEEATRTLERQSASERDRNDPGSPLRPEEGQERVGFEQREDVRRALEDQLGLQAEVDSLRRELEEMAEAMREVGMSDPGLREDLTELQELMKEIAPEEDAERLREMMDELDGQDLSQAQETLEELAGRQEEFRRQIEESIERLKRAAVEQDFRATTSEAEELAQQEEALADALREGDAPQMRAEQQEELSRRTEEMESSMQRLERRLQELGETEAASEVRTARETSTDSRESMQRAGQQARQQRGEEAGAQADQASEQLRETAEQLRQAQEQMANEQAQQLEEALRQATDDALSLARQQSSVRDGMRGATRQEMADLRGDVAAIEQGVRTLAQNLSVTTQAQGGANRALEVGVGEAIQALQETVGAMENAPGAPSPQSAATTAIDALNQVALMAAAAAQQVGQGGQSQGQQSAQGELQQQLEDLAQQQGQLNVTAGQVMPMQLGRQAMQSQMQQLSERQQSVADQLGELSEQPGNQEEALGDLEALAREAMELAQELAGSRMDATTRERQERLFHRLLDAGRSLEKEELSEERESERPGAFSPDEVFPLGPDALRALRFQLPAPEVLRRMSPAERQLVLQYFQRLNRGGSGTGSGAVRGPGSGGP